MFRPSRKRTGADDPLVAWKLRIFALGAALALAGIGFDTAWIVWVGIGVLGAGLLLRLLPMRS